MAIWRLLKGSFQQLFKRDTRAIVACASRVLGASALLVTGCHGGPVCPAGANLMGEPPPNGQEIWCEKLVEGKPVKEGYFALYYPNGAKMMQGAYHDGKQVGEWKTWYQNGQQSAVDHFRGGIQDGPHTSWYDNGQPAAEGKYENGKREGKWRRWDPNGFRNWDEVYKNNKKIS